MSQELKKAIEQIAKDKGIERELLVDTLEDAVRTSVIRKFGDDLDVEVKFNEDTGEIEVYQFKIVVDDVANDICQIDIDDAKLHDPSIMLDDEMGFRLKIEDLGRIAAQSAKQVIIQRMRDAEQGLIYNEYKERIGEIVTGVIQRRDKSGFIINIGKLEALLPRDEQMPREHYKRNERIQALLIDVRREGRGPQLIISRAHRDYIAALFRREIPEVDDGTIQIMAAARDPGLRAKVAVFSKDKDIDPVGACVGVRGSRIQNIVQELCGERIDIVIWSADIVTYAKNALSPAVISTINVNEEENLLEITVPDNQLTAAIGKRGQNVKLAAQLLGWKIDLYTESRYAELTGGGEKFSRGLEQLASVAEISASTFVDAGYANADAIKEASDEDLIEKLKLTEERLKELRVALNFLSTDSDGNKVRLIQLDENEQVKNKQSITHTDESN